MRTLCPQKVSELISMRMSSQLQMWMVDFFLQRDLWMRQPQFLTWAKTNKGPVNAVIGRIGGKSNGCECSEK
ncbi:hypothetical protein MP228_002840 [Amoeboaphelidium protococcarum]|nr:hypothetical protein MP228_002840 [Amoeboaphelidium protococcarum]